MLPGRVAPGAYGSIVRRPSGGLAGAEHMLSGRVAPGVYGSTSDVEQLKKVRPDTKHIYLT